MILKAGAIQPGTTPQRQPQADHSLPELLPRRNSLLISEGWGYFIFFARSGVGGLHSFHHFFLPLSPPCLTIMASPTDGSANLRGILDSIVGSIVDNDAGWGPSADHPIVVMDGVPYAPFYKVCRFLWVAPGLVWRGPAHVYHWCQFLSLARAGRVWGRWPDVAAPLFLFETGCGCAMKGCHLVCGFTDQSEPLS